MASGEPRKRVTAVAVDGASGHRCRMGNTQSLIERGVSIAAITMAGRWEEPGVVVR